jgi:hypothetical protein
MPLAPYIAARHFGLLREQSCYLERLHGTKEFVKSKDQGTDLQCAEENNGSRVKSTTGINYNPKIPYLETKAGDQT